MNHHAKELVRAMARLEAPPEPLEAVCHLTTRQLLAITRARLAKALARRLRDAYNRLRILAGKWKRSCLTK